jgi:hypothetical protein
LSEGGHLLDQGIREIPTESASLIRDRGVQVHWVANTGPYRKLIPILQERWNENVLIVTIDDDTLYPTWFLERLVAGYHRHRCIVAYRGRRVAHDALGRLAPYQEWPWLQPPETVTPLNYPIGQSGILYHPQFFTKRVFDPAAIELSPSADEPWFYANVRIKEIPVCVFGTSFPMLKKYNSKECLWAMNRARNDGQLAAVCRHLKIEL